MPAIQNLIARGVLAAREDDSNTRIITLFVVVLSLVFLGLLLVAALVIFRRMKRRQRLRDDTLPQYNDIVHDVPSAAGDSKRLGSSNNNNNNNNGTPRRLTIETRHGHSSVVYFKDGQPMLANPNSPPHSPDNVPEIHITFPEEEDESGRRKSGRVVVVRVGDNASVGLEPLPEEELPAYEKESSFYSIDMDRIGGLKEKVRGDYH